MERFLARGKSTDATKIPLRLVPASNVSYKKEYLPASLGITLWSLWCRMWSNMSSKNRNFSLHVLSSSLNVYHVTNGKYSHNSVRHATHGCI